MLIAYLDESGTHAGSSSVAVGGFMGPERQWRKFEKRWRRALKEVGLSHTHMAELESCLGLFASWDKSSAQRFQRELLAIIKDHGTWGVSCSVVLDDYKRLVLDDPDPELPKKVGTPYGICAARCIYLAAMRAKELHDKKGVRFVFESGVPTRELADWFDRQRRTLPGLGSLKYRSKTEAIALQAADIHAV